MEQDFGATLDARRGQDEASLRLVKQLTKKHPRKTCCAPIGKNGGCNYLK
jgi:hypothetical protein